MQLKKMYDPSKLVRDPEGKVIEVKAGAVRGVIVKRADHGTQKFTQKYLDAGLEEGWLSMSGGKITISNLEGDDLAYEIVRKPGHYCCHCDMSVGGSKGGAKHCNEQHSGIASPDPGNPSGYRLDNFYSTVNHAATVNLTTKEERVQFFDDLRNVAITKIGAKHRAPEVAKAQ